MQKTINMSKLKAAAKAKKTVVVKFIKAKLNNLKNSRVVIRKSMAVAKAQTKVLVNAKISASRAALAKSGKKASNMIKLLKSLKVIKVIRKRVVAAKKLITRKIKASKTIKKIAIAIKMAKKAGKKVSVSLVRKAKKAAKKMMKIRIFFKKGVAKAAKSVKKTAGKLRIRVKVASKHCHCEPKTKAAVKVTKKMNLKVTPKVKFAIKKRTVTGKKF
jgi:hypothetical protein